MFRGHSSLQRGQPFQLGDQELAVGLVGPLHPEVFAPVEQQVGRGVVAEHVAEPAELGRPFLEQVDGLKIEPVEQLQAAEAVRPLDRHGVPLVPLDGSGHQLAILGGGFAIAAQQFVLGRRPGRGLLADRAARRNGRVGVGLDGHGSNRQLGQHTEGCEQGDYREGLFHRKSRPPGEARRASGDDLEGPSGVTGLMTVDRRRWCVRMGQESRRVGLAVHTPLIVRDVLRSVNSERPIQRPHDPLNPPLEVRHLEATAGVASDYGTNVAGAVERNILGSRRNHADFGRAREASDGSSVTVGPLLLESHIAGR